VSINRAYPLDRALHASERLSRRGKQWLMVGWDAASASVALWAGFMLRLGDAALPPAGRWWYLLVPALVVPPVFWAFGLYREITRYIGPRYAWILLKGCIAVTGAFELLFLLTPGRGDGLPRTAPVIAGVLLFLATGGVRLAVRRFVRVHYAFQHRIAVVGASDVGAGLASAMGHDRSSLIVAFFDDAPALAGTALRGVRVHPIKAFDQVLAETPFDSLLVALSPKSRVACRPLLEHAAARGVQVLSVPTMAEIKDGRVNVDALKPLTIEDLLGRTPVEPDPKLLAANVTARPCWSPAPAAPSAASSAGRCWRLTPRRWCSWTTANSTCSRSIRN